MAIVGAVLLLAQNAISAESHFVTPGGQACIDRPPEAITRPSSLAGYYEQSVFVTNGCKETIHVTVCRTDRTFNCTVIAALGERRSGVPFGTVQGETSFQVFIKSER